MKCPILIKVTKKWFRPPIYEPMECLKEECAWWDEAHECCATIALNQTMVAIGNVLGSATLST